MKAIIRRVRKLEDRLGVPGKPRDRVQFVFSTIGIEQSLETAICSRTLQPDGKVLEYVDFTRGAKGSGNLNEEELNRWLDTFPMR
jgi:hypothetical protein